MKAFVSLESENHKLKELKKRFQPGSNLKPHITLLPPGELLVEQKAAPEIFNSVSALGGLALKSAGIGVFEQGQGGVVWLGFEPSEPLQSLHNELKQKLSGKVISAENLRDYYNPHLTLGRYKTAQERTIIEMNVRLEDLPAEVKFGSAVLLVKQAESDDWQKLAETRL